MNPWWPTVEIQVRSAYPPAQVVKAIAAVCRPPQSATDRLTDPGDIVGKPFEGTVYDAAFELLADPEELGHLRVAYTGSIAPADAGSLVKIKMAPSSLVAPGLAMFAAILGFPVSFAIAVWVVRLNQPSFFAVGLAAGGLWWLLPAFGMRVYLRRLAPRVTEYFIALLSAA